MKLTCYLILFLLPITFYGQHAGTFKVAKKEYEESLVKSKRNIFFYVALDGTFRQKKKTDTDVLFGLNFIRQPLFLGVKIGKADLMNRYKGVTLGVFSVYEYRVAHFLGRWKGSIPIEFSYERLISKLSDVADLNQYSIGTGLSLNVPGLSNTRIAFLVNYIVNTNPVTTFKGIRPTLRVNYVFGRRTRYVSSTETTGIRYI